MRFRAAPIGISLVAALSLVSSGQQPPKQPDGKPGVAEPATRPASLRAPAILDADGKPVAGVSLARADVHAIVRGPLAEAIVTLTFKNTQDRVLGGELTFPLPDGATISGYGLDVNGVMVDGVAVEKQQARVIYETEMRKTVDPGLVEHVIGNNFRTRLYPIPANGTRTVKVSYVADLIPTEGRKGAALSLPLGLGDKLEQFDLTIAVEGATEEPTVRGGTYANRPFQQVDRGFFLKESLKDAKAVETLTITLPEVPATSVTVQKPTAEPTTVEELEQRRKAGAAASSQAFFVLSDTPAMPRLEPAAMANRRLLVVWDASLSRKSADLSRELALLEKSLAKLNYPSFDVVLLRNDLELMQPTFGGSKEEAAKAIAALKAVTYDGATNLGVLSFPKNLSDLGLVATKKLPPNYDFALFFTDGVGNLGGEKPVRVDIPVWAVSSDASANHNALRSLCQQSGGAYLNLNRQADDAAIGTIGQPTFSVIAIEADAKQVADITPGVGTAIAGRVTAAGRLLSDEAKVTFVYGYGKTETSRRTFTIKSADASDGSLVARFWAQQKVNELALAGDGSRDELLAIGKQYNLVTPATSLLVLETVEQYVQYGIVPPKNRPEVYAAFTQQIENRRVAKEKTQEEKIAHVLQQWNQRVAWWEKEFKYPKDLKYTPPAGAKGEVAVAAGAVPPPGAVAPTGADPVATPAPGAPPMVHAPEPRPAAQAAQSAQPGRPPMNDRPRAGSDPHGNNAPDFNLATRDDARPHPTPAGERGGEGGGALFGNGGQNGQGRAQREVLQRQMALSKSQNGESEQDVSGRIDIKAWDPKTPYIAAMKAVAADKAYDVYLAQREQYAKSPAFYFDCAEHLLRVGQRQQGIRVLTDVLEMKLEDPRLIRIVAHRLQQLDELDLAIGLFEKVSRLRPEEPQSFRDLALALAARADRALAVPADKQSTGQIASDYGRALDLLNKVITGNWQRFEDIELIALMEANRISARLAATPGLGAVPNPIDGRLRKNLDSDVRIVLTWDADATDIDLWITEPSGEVCMYNHNRTIIGGAMSRDFTQGYGPEEYFLRKTMPGEYKIQANFYGSSQQELTGACTVQATVITNFGRPNEQRKQMTLRLTSAKEVATVGTVKLE
ncbi:VIT domain-containing protein [Humisphaera borealis]|uniref:DUF2135 domain-containing protein n=1 Tax=Humisphaera borealis TaxID=2807512 RepID=A0A7M2WXF4_9BACT|nr:VIT domain-containing protein [Humisphaera borealis]QOV90207.1 DUF2135 domain-containing protein [Humisphaera borealis]